MTKWFAKRTTIDGITFASKAEAKRYGELRLLVKAGVIRDLVLQPVYPLHARGGMLIGVYLADFRYVVVITGVQVIEDVKSVRTPIFRWKKKHFEAQYGCTLTEVAV